ncbi:hypothetical protein JEZ13_01700 [bacterium]|nr:hypothetical protein [bacterium]
MKHFLHKTLLFGLLPLLILLFCEIEHRIIPNNYTFKKNYIETNGKNIDLLIFGSSHALCAINPEDISNKSFSLASSGQSLYFDNLLLTKYSNNFQSLKTIIISISYFSLYAIPNTGAEALVKYDYLRYHDIGKEIIDQFDFKKYLITYNKGIKPTVESIIKYNIYNKNNITCNRYGADISNNNIRNIDYLKKDAIKASNRHENSSLDFSKSLKHLTDIINYAKDKEITVFFVITPFTDFYFNEINPVKVKSTNEILDSLAIANSNVEFLNYAQDERFGYQEFNNSDHLNLAGQRKFSKILDRDIKLIRKKDK